jgi:hypothetical protein
MYPRTIVIVDGLGVKGVKLKGSKSALWQTLRCPKYPIRTSIFEVLMYKGASIETSQAIYIASVMGLDIQD